MKRKILGLLAIAILALSAIVLNTPLRAFACSSNCTNTGTIQYNISNVTGIKLTVSFDKISTTACTSGESCYFLMRGLYIGAANFNWIGLESDYGASAPCNALKGNTTQHEYVKYGYGGTILDCVEVPVTDIGTCGINLQANNYTSNGGGVQYWANDSSCGHTFCTGSTCFKAGQQETGSPEQFQDAFDVSGAFSSTKLTLSTETSALNGLQYGPSCTNWCYLSSTTGNGSITGGNPPWLGWVSGQAPSDGTITGGNWYGCAANTGSNPC